MDGQGVVDVPLLNAAVRVDQFLIEIDALSYIHVAAAYRPLARWIEIRDLAWSVEPGEMVVTVRTEAVGTNSLLHPITRAYLIPAAGDFPLNLVVLKLLP